MQAAGSGAQGATGFFTAPITGNYSFEADLTVGSVTGSGNMGAVVSGIGVLAEANNGNNKSGAIKFLAQGAAVTYTIEKPGTISNSPDWTLELRVRLVGGPDLTQED